MLFRSVSQAAHASSSTSRSPSSSRAWRRCSVWETDLVDRELLRKAVLEKRAGQELALTGRRPADWMGEAADYSTEMRCHRHPFHRGVPAREGVEF